jgi:hypothetical protein
MGTSSTILGDTMKCFRGSRNSSYNEAFITALISWRCTARNNQLKSITVEAKDLAGLKDIARLRVEMACLPVLHSLEQLKRSYDLLIRECGRR